MESEHILYIIANGVDLHHGLDSKWRDFYRSLAIHEKESAENLPLYDFPCVEAENWHEPQWDFQGFINELGSRDDIPELSDHFGWTYPVQDGKKYDPHGLQFRLGSHFLGWTFRLSHQPIPLRKKFLLKPEAYYISFNSTDLPERLYGIDPARIDCVNGKVTGQSDISTGKFPVVLTQSWSTVGEKCPPVLIREEKDFTPHYAQITPVAVIGRSFPEKDIPFFRNVAERLPSNCQWTVTVYEQTDIDRQKDLPGLLRIPPGNLRSIDCNPLRIKQKKFFDTEDE